MLVSSKNRIDRRHQLCLQLGCETQTFANPDLQFGPCLRLWRGFRAFIWQHSRFRIRTETSGRANLYKARARFGGAVCEKHTAVPPPRAPVSATTLSKSCSDLLLHVFADVFNGFADLAAAGSKLLLDLTT